MPPPLGAGWIWLSGCPSISPSIHPAVWSPRYPLSTCTWVRWAIRQTVTVFWPVHRSVYLSIHLDRFLDISHGGNGLKFYMLLYPDHLLNWLDYGQGLLIFCLLASLLLSETGQIWGFWAFSRQCMEEMACNFESWFILTTFRIDKIMVMVCWFFLFWR